MRRHAARSSDCIASASSSSACLTAAPPRACSVSNRRRIRAMAQNRLMAVGRVDASSWQMPSSSARSAGPSPAALRTPRAMPKAAATPMAGAPRMAMSLIAAATSAWLRQRIITCSAGSRRWSMSTTSPSCHSTVGTIRGS